MKRTILLLLLLTALPVSGQRGRQGGIRELKPQAPFTSAVPAECTQVVRSLIKYFSQSKPDIFADKQSQHRWLSDDLRKGMEHRQQVYKEFAKKEAESPEGPPSNADFLNAWEMPTSFAIVGGQRTGDRATVIVQFIWGKATNYPGDTRLMSFIFVLENGKWKLDDIYTYRGKFAQAGSLSATLARDSYP